MFVLNVPDFILVVFNALIILFLFFMLFGLPFFPKSFAIYVCVFYMLANARKGQIVLFDPYMLVVLLAFSLLIPVYKFLSDN